MPDIVDTVIWAPDDGWKYHPKHVEQFADINKLYIVASCWKIIDTYDQIFKHVLQLVYLTTSLRTVPCLIVNYCFPIGWGGSNTQKICIQLEALQKASMTRKLASGTLNKQTIELES